MYEKNWKHLKTKRKNKIIRLVKYAFGRKKKLQNQNVSSLKKYRRQKHSKIFSNALSKKIPKFYPQKNQPQLIQNEDSKKESRYFEGTFNMN